MILLIIAILIHIYATYTTYERVKLNGTRYRRPLYDLIHDNTPNLSKYSRLVDVLLVIFILPYILNYNLHYVTHFINVFSIIIILRSFALLMTDIPTSDVSCDPRKISIYNLFFGHCSDKIFSGHTSFTLLAVLVAYNFNLLNNVQLLLLAIVQVLYALLIIMTRCHYSVDVLLSYYIVIPLYYCILHLSDILDHNKIF